MLPPARAWCTVDDDDDDEEGPSIGECTVLLLVVLLLEVLESGLNGEETPPVPATPAALAAAAGAVPLVVAAVGNGSGNHPGSKRWRTASHFRNCPAVSMEGKDKQWCKSMIIKACKKDRQDSAHSQADCCSEGSITNNASSTFLVRVFFGTETLSNLVYTCGRIRAQRSRKSNRAAVFHHPVLAVSCLVARGLLLRLFGQRKEQPANDGAGSSSRSSSRG